MYLTNHPCVFYMSGKQFFNSIICLSFDFASVGGGVSCWCVFVCVLLVLPCTSLFYLLRISYHAEVSGTTSPLLGIWLGLCCQEAIRDAADVHFHWNFAHVEGSHVCTPHIYIFMLIAITLQSIIYMLPGSVGFFLSSGFVHPLRSLTGGVQRPGLDISVGHNTQLSTGRLLQVQCEIQD